MGVSGSGKTTVGRSLAERWGDDFIESDDLHSADEIQKMSSGIALGDLDRLPWLRTVGERLRAETNENRRTVTACSALKYAYREILRLYAPTAFFVELDGPRDFIRARITARHHAFMSPALLDSQFDTLEPLAPGEFGVRVDATLGLDATLHLVESALAAQSLD
jgi:gluconokinase